MQSGMVWEGKLNTALFVNATVGFCENLFLVIVAFLENATIGYSLESVCVCVCVRVCVCVCVCVFAR